MRELEIRDVKAENLDDLINLCVPADRRGEV